MPNSEVPKNSGNQDGFSNFSPQQLARFSRLKDMLVLEKDDSTIPFMPEQIDVIVGLFSKNRYGETLKKYLKPEWKTRCQRDLFSCSSLAIAAVDLRDAFIEDEEPGEEPTGYPAQSLIVCRDHVETAWAILEKGIMLDRTAYDPDRPPSVGINGFMEKELKEMFPTKT